MRRLLLLPVLLFTLEGVLCGYSTGFHKTPAPKDGKDVITTVVYPSPHPKQRFIGHHEGWLRNAEVYGEGEVPEISKPQVEEIPVASQKEEIWDKDSLSIDIEPAILPPKEVIVNPPTHIEEHKDKYPESIHTVKDIQVEEKPSVIVDPPKNFPIEERPAIIIDDKSEVIVDPPKNVHIEDQPVIIVNPPKDIQIEERPIPVITSKPEDEIRVRPEIPYPVKVTNENSNLNLYEMLQRPQTSRFVHLIEEAELQELLSGDESITIFAPSDYALSKLKADEVRRLASDRDLLRQFILYHCVDGSIFGSTLVNDPLRTKIDRNILMANYRGEKWYVNGVEIQVRDQVCKNGVIHIIDTPLYPFPVGGILETLEAAGNFKIFTELLRNAKLDVLLKGESRWTIFAPTDAAFSKLPPANVEWLKWDIPAIKNLFNKVACRGYYYTSWINSGSTSPPLSLANESMDFSGFPVSSINGISLSQRDITADNGCIQAIDDIWFSSALAPGDAFVEKKS